MSFSQVLALQHGSSIKNKLHITADSLEEALDHFKAPQIVQTPVQIVNPELHDVFGDFICGIAFNIHRYWSQFGYGDRSDIMNFTDHMLSILKRVAHVELIPIEEEDLHPEDDYIFVKEPAV